MWLARRDEVHFMVKRIAFCVNTVLMLCCLAVSYSSLAVAAPQLTLQANERVSGVLQDGELITQGRIATQDSHVGFQLWSDAEASANAPNRYLVPGGQHSEHRLRVRIEQAQGQPDSVGGKGLRIDTRDNIVAFKIVADGEQTVVADSYLFEMKGAVIGPEQAEQGDVSAQAIALNFRSEQALKHQLFATQAVFLNHLTDNALLARGVVSTLDTSPQKMAVRFTPGFGEFRGEGNTLGVILIGNNNPENKLRVKLQLPDSLVSDQTWWVNAQAHASLMYTINADGAQRVPADSYTVSVDSVVWRD
jgi:hypothetical protein